MREYVDHSVFPDVEELPNGFSTDLQKADYVQRICGAWISIFIQKRRRYACCKGGKTSSPDFL